MVYVLVFACIWAGVGALVFLGRTNIGSPQKMGLTIVTSLVFGAIGWVDVSSIYHTVHSGPAVMAKQSAGPASQQASSIR